MSPSTLTTKHAQTSNNEFILSLLIYLAIDIQNCLIFSLSKIHKFWKFSPHSPERTLHAWKFPEMWFCMARGVKFHSLSHHLYLDGIFTPTHCAFLPFACLITHITFESAACHEVRKILIKWEVKGLMMSFVLLIAMDW